jgi:hypothetical protein
MYKPEKFKISHIWGKNLIGYLNVVEYEFYGTIV